MPQRSIRFPDDLAARADADATRQDRSFSWLVVRALEAYLERGYEPTAAQREAMDTIASDALQALCGHEARQVSSDGRAVSCGMCGAVLEPNAEDLRRLAVAPPEPVSVPYAAPHPDDIRSLDPEPARRVRTTETRRHAATCKCAVCKPPKATR